MYKVDMHAGAIRKLVYGCVYVWEIIHWLELVDYLPVHTHKPYNNLHLFMKQMKWMNILAIYCYNGYIVMI